MYVNGFELQRAHATVSNLLGWTRVLYRQYSIATNIFLYAKLKLDLLLSASIEGAFCY